MLGGTKVGQEAEEVKGRQGQEPLSFCRKDKTNQDKQTGGLTSGNNFSRFCG